MENTSKLSVIKEGRICKECICVCCGHLLELYSIKSVYKNSLFIS